MSLWNALALACVLVIVTEMILNYRNYRKAAYERATSDQKLLLQRLQGVATGVQVLAASQIVAALVQDRLQSPHYREYTERHRALMLAQIGSSVFRVTSERALAEAEQKQDHEAVEQIKQKMAELKELDENSDFAKDMAWQLDPRNPDVQEDLSKLAASLLQTLTERVKESAQ